MSARSRQSTEQLKAEIAFRAKLARQHVTGEVLLPDYYTKDEHDRILLERIETTRRRMRQLAAAGIRLSPFLELGAERGQRSLVLVNEFGAQGVAADISYHQLRAMEHFAELFELPRLALRVCCDANRLPFRGGAFPFVFCYQFLHHFPSLEPILAEIRRVMGGGYFLFAEEPYRRALRVRLYRGVKPYSARARGRNRYLRLLESFVSAETSDEMDHGVVENDDISLSEWATALAAFDGHDSELRSMYDLRSSLDRSPGPRNAVNWLLGGTVTGLCRSSAAGAPGTSADVIGLLRCPVCVAGTGPHVGDASLVTAGDAMTCTSCGNRYPIREGIIFLIPPGQLAELYPEVGR